MAYQATDTFVAEIDGAPVAVQRGTVLAPDHPVVKALGKTALFTQVTMDDEAPKKKRGRPSNADKAAAAAAEENGDSDDGDDGDDG
jgi:hypothetical protein